MLLLERVFEYGEDLQSISAVALVLVDIVFKGDDGLRSITKEKLVSSDSGE